MKKKSPVGWHVLTLVIVLALVALVVYLSVNGVSLFLLSQFEWFRNWFWPIILVIAVLCIVLLIVSSKMKQNVSIQNTAIDIAESRQSESSTEKTDGNMDLF